MADAKGKELLELVKQAEQDGILAIIDLTDESVETDDFDEDRRITYQLVEPDETWLHGLITVMPCAAELGIADPSVIADLLLSTGRDMLVNLKHVFVAADGDDMNEICRIAGADPDEFPETVDLEGHDALGCLWATQGSILVDLTAIRDTVKEMAKSYEADGCPFDAASEELIGLCTTITHEIRHLGLSNPFMDKTDEECSEEAVERWGIEAYEDWNYGHA